MATASQSRARSVVRVNEFYLKGSRSKSKKGIIISICVAAALLAVTIPAAAILLSANTTNSGIVGKATKNEASSGTAGLPVNMDSGLKISYKLTKGREHDLGVHNTRLDVSFDGAMHQVATASLKLPNGELEERIFKRVASPRPFTTGFYISRYNEENRDPIPGLYILTVKDENGGILCPPTKIEIK